MKLLQYLQYFFYIGINWNWKIAFITLKQEMEGEKKYGINTTGADELKQLKTAGIDISHSTIYMPVSYKVIENAFAQISSVNKNHFLDIGCGKGRALSVAAFNGFKKVTGIDFSKKFCEDSLQNLALVKHKVPGINFSVISEDAGKFDIPDDVDCILLFNPFDHFIMDKTVRNICRSLDRKPRVMNVIYANPLYKNLFTQNNFTEAYHNKSYKYFEVSILSFRQ